MTMNCKQGDLAIVKRSAAGNEGKIVRCLHMVMGNGTWGYGPRWVTDPQLQGTHPSQQFVLDSCLRPIRGTEGQDEMLRIAGMPVTLEPVLT